MMMLLSYYGCPDEYAPTSSVEKRADALYIALEQKLLV